MRWTREDVHVLCHRKEEISTCLPCMNQQHWMESRAPREPGFLDPVGVDA